MPKENLILDQFMHENETWKRLLGFLEEESIMLKNRLSEVAGAMNNNDGDLLERLEDFQNYFLKEDETIKFLKKEINEEDKLLARDIYEDGNLFLELKSRQKKMRKRVVKAEQEFNKLKLNFNTFLGEYL
jgi:hypothetical protein